MAVQVRSRRLVNPARKKNAARKRKLSPKQIAIFGTKRQKAALRASRSRKRNAGTYSIRKTKKRFGKRRSPETGRKISTTLGRDLRRMTKKRRKKNVGEIVSISLAGLTGNPGRKRRKRNSGMARHRKLKMTKAAKAARRSYRRRAHKNPSVRRNRGRRMNAGHRRHHRRRNSAIVVRRINRGRRRRNPSIAGLTSGVIGSVLGVTTGAVGSRYLPQLVLGGNNTGIIGYVGNLVSAVALGYVGKMLTKSPSFGTSVMAGGIASTLLRVLSDNTSLGTYINSALSGAGKGGDAGLGIIQNSSFFAPQVAVPGSMTSFITPAQTRGYVSNAVAQVNQMRAAGNKGGMGTVFGMRKRAVM